MPYKGKLGGRAVQTATAIALEKEFEQYFKYNARCIDWQSQRGAFLARKHLQKIKELAQRRKLELLQLYTSDPRRLNEHNNNIISGGSFDAKDTKNEEEQNG